MVLFNGIVDRNGFQHPFLKSFGIFQFIVIINVINIFRFAAFYLYTENVFYTFSVILKGPPRIRTSVRKWGFLPFIINLLIADSFIPCSCNSVNQPDITFYQFMYHNYLNSIFEFAKIYINYEKLRHSLKKYFFYAVFWHNFVLILQR